MNTPEYDGPYGEAATYERHQHVATITYNRPNALNAINKDLRRDLNAAWHRFIADEEAWVGIITGAGNKSFCAGADLNDGTGAIGEFPGTFWEMPTINSFESGMEIFKPTIAAVNGHCIGYGLTTATACDFVIAADHATFSWPEVTIGIPTIVGAIRLPKKIRWADAMELLLTGETIDAERAHKIGLVWKVVPGEDLLKEAQDLASRLCKAAPLASRATKEVATRTASMSWSESVRFGETMRRLVTESEDSEEGRLAWSEKRKAEWHAR